jgi:hypothetical protein
MHARPEVARVLIKKKMRQWLSIARYRPDCNRAQARRNFLRLLAKHPEIGRELKLTIVSPYE